MSKRESIQQGRLEKLESEFLLLLPRILKRCAAGRWGLFGQNDHLEESSYLHWPEAEQLKDMAREIHSIREISESLIRRLSDFCITVRCVDRTCRENRNSHSPYWTGRTFLAQWDLNERDRPDSAKLTPQFLCNVSLPQRTG
jgi:hypothetical protein